MKTLSQTILFSAILFFASCSTEVSPIEYGVDDCHWCQMRIMDPKFGSEAVTEKGRTYKFDSAECLLHYLNANETKYSHVVVTDFENPETFIAAKSASYLISENMPSPMGGFLNAFKTKKHAETFQSSFQGDIFTWEQMLTKYSK